LGGAMTEKLAELFDENADLPNPRRSAIRKPATFLDTGRRT
jgi:hypothetical protein